MDWDRESAVVAFSLSASPYRMGRLEHGGGDRSSSYLTLAKERKKEVESPSRLMLRRMPSGAGKVSKLCSSPRKAARTGCAKLRWDISG